MDQKLKDFIYHWAIQHNYFDGNFTLKNHALYDVGYDLKSTVEDSRFNDSPGEHFDIWYDLFLEDEIIPILISYGALEE